MLGPLLLLGAGVLLGLLVAPGPAPDLLALGSCVLCGATYAGAVWVARRGRAGLVAGALVATALVLAVLAFGPSPVLDRKVTGFNAWTFALGAALPPLVSPPPHPNAVAGVLAVSLGLAGAAALAGVQRRLSGPAVVLIAVALVLTASRAGWLAGIAAGAVLLLQKLGRGRGALGPRLALIGLAGAGLLLAVLVPADPATGTDPLLSTYSLGVRLEQWNQTWTLLQPRPLVGLGLARFPAAYAQAVAGSGLRPYDTPANALLELWADAGVLGLAAAGWMTWRAARLVAAAPGFGPAGWLPRGLGAALVAFAVDGAFEAVTAIVWRAGAGYGYLASPLPFLLLGLLAGTCASVGHPAHAEIPARARSDPARPGVV